MMDYKMT
ncbi:rCG49517 [Rattus norvegicus]|nr:rCG49517 [Rattus norvegicus]